MPVLIIAWRELKESLSDPIRAATILLMPLMIIALLSVAMTPVMGGDAAWLSGIPIAAAPGGPAGTAFLDLLSSAAGPLFSVEHASSEHVERMMVSGRYAAGVVVEENEDGNVVRLFPSSARPVSSAVARMVIMALADATNARTAALRISERWLSPTDAAAMVERVTAEVTAPGPSAVDRDSARTAGPTLSATQYFSATMLVFFLLASGITVAYAVMRDRESGLGWRVSSLPVSRSAYLGGKVVGAAWLALLKAAAIIGFSRFALGVTWGSDLITIAAVVLLTIAISSALGLLGAALFDSPRAVSTGMSFIIWVMTLVSGGFTPLPVSDWVSGLTFNRRLVHALHQTMLGQPDAGVGLWGLALFAVGLMVWALHAHRRRLPI